MDAIYVGTVEKVYPPGSSQNSSKYQYEYAVAISIECYGQTTINNCIKSDMFGGFDDFDDLVLSPGNLVLITFPKENMRAGIIMGCIRNYTKKTDSKLGVHSRRRFNKFEVGIDSSYNWSAKSDFGPNAHVMVDKIILDDSSGQKITLDKNTKTITIEAQTWTVNISGDVSMTVGGNANLIVNGNVDAKVEGTLNAKVSKDATLDIGGNANLKVAKSLNAKVGGQATIKASQIALNGDMGQILTTQTSPIVDFLTGISTVGVPNVKAGGG